MGGVATRAVADLLAVRGIVRVPVGWGSVTGCRGSFDGGAFVGLPHLSRFAIVGRAESDRAIRELFPGDWLA
jgi:hypothetical protein